jgi:uncharacterized protein
VTVRKKLLGDWRGRLTKVAMTTPEPRVPEHMAPQHYPAVQAELRSLRERLPQLTGSLVASSDGLLIEHDLPAHLEPASMAALSAAQLSLSYRLANTANGGGFSEVVVHGTEGQVVIYAAGHTSLTVLAGPEVNVGRLHLESRPVARVIAGHLAAAHND